MQQPSDRVRAVGACIVYCVDDPGTPDPPESNSNQTISLPDSFPVALRLAFSSLSAYRWRSLSSKNKLNLEGSRSTTRPRFSDVSTARLRYVVTYKGKGKGEGKIPNLVPGTFLNVKRFPVLNLVF